MGCAGDPNDLFTQVYTCCFIRSNQSGRYDILESQGDSLVTGLHNWHGDCSSKRVRQKLLIRREQDTLTIQRGGPFTRIGP